MSTPEMIQDFLAALTLKEGVTPTLIQTHISWVILAGPFAYKIKKPVKFAFVDFTSLEKREHACREELRLNRRLAPDVYLGVLPVMRKGASEVIDWAVKMRAFDAKATLDQLPDITETQVDAIADAMARFHAQAPGIDPDSSLGSAAQITETVRNNLQELHGLLPGDAAIADLHAWTEHELEKLSGFFAARKAAGMIKDGHGDLHLGNIAWDHGKPLIFDCIEFSETLRGIDVINEMAFLFMDLCARGDEPLAWRMLNRYLEFTGDYAGTKGLRFYSLYRALVRAKISKHQNKDSDGHRYLKLALALIKPGPPQLLLMHGHSGSGKTYWSQKILQERGMVRLRSDVERKRLFTADRYLPQATEATFHRLHDLAQELLLAGVAVIVDATFLKRPLRTMFMGLADRLHAPVHIVDVAATPKECRQRIRARITQDNDASEADLEVLDLQLKTSDPLSDKEKTLVLSPQQLVCMPV